MKETPSERERESQWDKERESVGGCRETEREGVKDRKKETEKEWCKHEWDKSWKVCSISYLSSL